MTILPSVNNLHNVLQMYDRAYAHDYQYSLYAESHKGYITLWVTIKGITHEIVRNATTESSVIASYCEALHTTLSTWNTLSWYCIESDKTIASDNTLVLER